MIYFYTYKTSIGEVTLEEEDAKLIRLNISSLKPNGILKETEVIKKAYQELEEYLKGKRKKFTVPLNPKGTSFQRKVFEELLKIPYGETISYQELGRRIGNIKACRAVGMANNKNPLPIFIPCHRVIGKNQKLTGYALGLELKKYLLDLEKRNN